jgi:hypothetical protein
MLNVFFVLTAHDGAPEPDGDLMDVVRSKIRHYRGIYLNHLHPIDFLSVVGMWRGCLWGEKKKGDNTPSALAFLKQFFNTVGG